MFLEFPEGATPIDDCSGLIPVWVHHLNDLNRVEAENILNAQNINSRYSTSVCHFGDGALDFK